MRSITEWMISVAAGLAFSAYAFDLGDHDRARQALDAGEILPLKTVLEKLNQDTPGRVMEVELERKNARWVYEIKFSSRGLACNAEGGRKQWDDLVTYWT